AAPGRPRRGGPGWGWPSSRKSRRRIAARSPARAPRASARCSGSRCRLRAQEGGTMSTDTTRPSPEHFLALLRDQQRGRSKVYLGFAPGVGKTYEMLQEGHRLKRQGVDVVTGVVETHGRADTAAMIGDLEQVPQRTVEYRGVTLKEMDLDAVLKRRPTVALVDELAHTNAPGSKNAKRYQ